jgi:flavin reductase (DIM6/NTAB) family NADH-FMN oxidoreductase RutF
MRESAALAEPVSAVSFRQALTNLASGVMVITAYGAAGPLGLTATSFVSVSLVPPLVLVCLGRGRRTHDGVVGAERCGVSVLEERQAWIAERFARPDVVSAKLRIRG